MGMSHTRYTVDTSVVIVAGSVVGLDFSKYECLQFCHAKLLLLPSN